MDEWPCRLTVYLKVAFEGSVELDLGVFATYQAALDALDEVQSQMVLESCYILPETSPLPEDVTVSW